MSQKLGVKIEVSLKEFKVKSYNRVTYPHTHSLSRYIGVII